MRGGGKEHGRGRSGGPIAGGFGTKIHALPDALGNPLELVLTGGQARDIGQAPILLGLTSAGAEVFVDDQGCDGDALIRTIEVEGVREWPWLVFA